MIKNIVLFCFTFCVGFWAYGVFGAPKISVVMPTYNRPQYLAMAIESILSQTYKNFEFIIVDNGSDAPTRNILENFARLDKRIKLVMLPENKGISYARNLGNALAKGKYIAVMDSDDYSVPFRLEAQLAFMEQNKDVALATSLKKSMDGRLYNKIPMKNYEPFLLFGHYLGHPEWILRTDFIRAHQIRYDETRRANVDYDFIIKLVLARGHIGYIDENLLWRRVHRENPPEYYLEQGRNALETSKAFIRRFDVPDEVIKRYQVCEITSYVVKTNKTKKYLNQDLLEQFYQQCQKKASPNA